MQALTMRELRKYNVDIACLSKSEYRIATSKRNIQDSNTGWLKQHSPSDCSDELVDVVWVDCLRGRGGGAGGGAGGLPVPPPPLVTGVVMGGADAVLVSRALLRRRQRSIEAVEGW